MNGFARASKYPARWSTGESTRQSQQVHQVASLAARVAIGGSAFLDPAEAQLGRLGRL
jgi:hypothetical protein